MELYSLTPDALLDYFNRLLAETKFRMIIDENGESPLVCEEGVISNFILVPIAEVTEIAKTKSTHRLKAAVYKNGKLTQPVEIAMNTLFQPRKWHEIWGITMIGVCESGQAEVLRFIFSKLSSAIASEESYRYTGWSHDGDSFLLGNLKLSKDTVVPVRHSILKKAAFDESIQPSTLVEFVLTHYLCVLTKPVYTQIIFCFTMLSLLFSKITDTCSTTVKFALYIKSLYGSGKTTVITALTNPWGAETLSFEDTEAALTQALKDCRDLPTLIDDMSKSKRPGMVAKAERIARLVGDPGTSAKKMKGGERYNEGISCLSIMSGEEVPALQLSSYVRMLILSLEPELFNWEEVTCLQNNRVTLTSFWVRFLQYIMNREDVMASLETAFIRYRSEVLDEFRQNRMNNRYAEMYGWLMAAWGLFTEYSASSGITVADYEFGTHLKGLLITQNMKYGLKTPSELFLTAFYALIETDRLTIVSYEEAKNGAPFDVMHHASEWWVRSGIVYRKIKKYYEEHNMDCPFSEKAMRKDLADTHLLKIPANAKGTLTTEWKDRQNKSSQCMVLYESLCKNFIEKGDLDNEH